jgi:hypothetical protein
MPMPAETCPWQLSGPQFPPPTAIQQRYCYPRGPVDYSSRKGGALWTMYGTDGKEDLEFRLLHVYFSAKRAINKGVIIPAAELAAAAAAANLIRSPNRGTPNKKKRQASNQLTSPPRRKALLPHMHQQRQQQHRQYPHPHAKQSPATTASSFNSSSSLCTSPLSFDPFMPTSPPVRGLATGTPGSSSLPPDLFRHHFHPVPDAALLTPSPFRRGPQQHQQVLSSRSNHSIRHSPVVTSRGAEEDLFFASDMDSPLQELDSYWNDPFLNTMMLQPSLEVTMHSAADTAADAPTLLTHNSTKTTTVIDRLALSLDGVHDTIRESILAAGHAEQPALVSLVATWARRVATDPLKSPTAPAAFPLQQIPTLWQLHKKGHPQGSVGGGGNGRDNTGGEIKHHTMFGLGNDPTEIVEVSADIAALKTAAEKKDKKEKKADDDDDGTTNALSGKTAAV